ncbi:MAG TPA: type II toxin-antitoxin system RelE/ParE family toxin [Gemmataceae bacterium]|jgi:plasmid stabilization system protein ParE|nr:type II toxin-antitoxin system RelE/ParE family toxin [Gemmataceae bacterium]
MISVILRPEAEWDLAEARDWYEGHRVGLGEEFLAAVQEILERIRESPESYAVVYRGIRWARLRRFPYLAYYRVIDKSIEVLAVLHGSRHPRVWRSRA